MRLSRRAEPFDSELFIYELKIDGFRALAQRKRARMFYLDHVESDGGCCLSKSSRWT
jgi:hypothetical protein